MATEEIKSPEEFDEPEEPSLTSSDPNERKLARRLRIQRRLEALRRQDGVEEEELEEKTAIEKQRDTSAELLDKLISEGEEMISNVRVANDAREVQRRREEIQARRKLLATLEKEAEESSEKYRAINEKWAGILASNDPLDIHSEMQAQKESGLKILTEKNQVISELKQELENADDKFTMDQKKQSDDINLLIDRIDNQVTAVAKAYRRELVFIENAIESERKILLTMNAKKWDSLYRQRNQNEQDGMEQRKEIMAEYDHEMKRVIIEHHEEYRAQKIWLETEYQTLQQEVQRMKAMCMMNIEKLDYSYAVLKRREDENTIIKSQQKRRINKLQDLVNGLKKTYMDLEESTKIEIQKLTEQVIKAHKSILELEEKSNHFTAINENQYLKIWDMNAKNATELADKILTADRIIHEQTLGVEWEPPGEPLLAKEDLPSYCRAMCAIQQKEVESKGRRKRREAQETTTDLTQTNAERQLLHRIMVQIADQSGFLIEDQLRELLAPHTTTDKTIIRLSDVFQALSIESENEVAKLLDIFVKYASCPTCTAQGEKKTAGCEQESGRRTTESLSDNSFTGDGMSDTSSGSTENSLISEKQGVCLGTRQTICDKGHFLIVETVNVMKALKEFVAKYHADKGDEIPPSFQSKLAERKLTVSRTLTVEDITEFWRRYREIFPAKKEKLWDGLLIGLHKYHEVLKERHKLNAETEHLRSQNSELRRLLEMYMLKVQ